MTIAAIIASVAISTQGQAADQIDGYWRMPDGRKSEIAHCNAGYCITVRGDDGKNRLLGTLAPSGNAYVGQLSLFSGKIHLVGLAKLDEGGHQRLTLDFCTARLNCISQIWRRP